VCVRRRRKYFNAERVCVQVQGAAGAAASLRIYESSASVTSQRHSLALALGVANYAARVMIIIESGIGSNGVLAGPEPSMKGKLLLSLRLISGQTNLLFFCKRRATALRIATRSNLRSALALPSTAPHPNLGQTRSIFGYYAREELPPASQRGLFEPRWTKR
jgi:hypothetical protein